MPPTNPDAPDKTITVARVEQDYDCETPPSIAIVKAIGRIEGIDPVNSPTELGLRLHDHIDPTALNLLVTELDTNDTITLDLTPHAESQYSVWIAPTDYLIVEKVIPKHHYH